MSLEAEMKTWILAASVLALTTAAPLAAQTPNFGVGVILGVPTGALNSASYGDGSSETYNTGFGAQFTASWPVEQNLALRLNVSAITFDGTGSAPRTYNWNVQDSMFSVGGEAEIYLPDGNAQRHLGTYLIGGLHTDFERFSASDYDPTYFAATTVNKTRLAATAGVGHTFRAYGRYHWTLEAAYHKTLTGTDSNDSAGVGFPASDYLKVYAGFAF
jgi:hypothetical protein